MPPKSRNCLAKLLSWRRMVRCGEIWEH